MKLQITGGTTSKLLRLFIQDSSVSTGAGLTGLTNASAGLTAYYIREGAASATSISIVSATVGTFTSSGFKEVDATNMPGVYEIGIPNAAIAAGANSVLVMYKGATNMVPVLLEIQIQSVDVYDGVRSGLTALPNAAAEAAGGLFTRGTGAGQVNQAANGMIDTNSVRLNNVSQSLLDLKDFADDGYDPSTNKVQGVVLVDTLTTYTGNTPQTGDNFARLGAPVGASISADIAGVQSDTDNLQTRVPAALVGGRIDASVGAMATNVLTATAINADALTAAKVAADVGVEFADALLDRDMSTGSDSGSPTVRTVRQALRALRNRFGFVGATRTVYKEDDATASWTSVVTTSPTADPIISDDPAGP